MSRKTVVISSASLDLPDHRAVVAEARLAAGQHLRAANRLAPAQHDWIALFDNMLRKLDGPPP